MIDLFLFRLKTRNQSSYMLENRLPLCNYLVLQGYLLQFTWLLIFFPLPKYYWNASIIIIKHQFLKRFSVIGIFFGARLPYSFPSSSTISTSRESSPNISHQFYRACNFNCTCDKAFQSEWTKNACYSNVFLKIWKQHQKSNNSLKITTTY